MNKPEKNWLEWAVFVVSVALIVAVLGVLLTEARSPASPPDLVLTLRAPQQGKRGFRMPVIVKNSGGETAEQVHLEVTLTLEGREVEKSDMTMAFVPRASQREGVVVFERDPRLHMVESRITGYETP